MITIRGIELNDADCAVLFFRALMRKELKNGDKIYKDNIWYDDLINIFKINIYFKRNTMNKVDYFLVCENELNKKASYFKAFLIDGKVEILSWRRCLQPDYKTDALNDAMRLSISDQIYEFKNHNIMQCVNCGTQDNIQIDHIVSFKDLSKDFVSNYKGKIPNKFVKMGIRNTFSIDDNEFKLAWRQYHLDNAKLQPLCKYCNLAKCDNKKEYDSKIKYVESLINLVS